MGDDGAGAHVAHEFGKHVYLLAANAVFCFSFIVPLVLLRGIVVTVVCRRFSFGVFAPGYMLNLVFRLFIFNGAHLISGTVYRNL